MATATSQDTEELQLKLDQVREIPGLIVELVGSWIWVSGETKKHKDQLKALGFWWSHKREKWYFHTGKMGGFSSSKSYKQLKQKYGATKVKDLEDDNDE